MTVISSNLHVFFEIQEVNCTTSENIKWLLTFFFLQWYMNRIDFAASFFFSCANYPSNTISYISCYKPVIRFCVFFFFLSSSCKSIYLFAFTTFLPRGKSLQIGVRDFFDFGDDFLIFDFFHVLFLLFCLIFSLTF